jgi:hypothetical protein
MRQEEFNNKERIEKEELRRKIKLLAQKNVKTLILCTKIKILVLIIIILIILIIIIT